MKIVTIYKKKDCKPCEELEEKIKDIKHFKIKFLTIKDKLDKDGNLLEQYAIDEADNKIKMKNIMKIFPSAVIGGSYLHGLEPILDFLTNGYINLIKGAYCPEVGKDCIGSRCKKFQVFENKNTPFADCSDRWSNKLIIEMREEYFHSSNKIIEKLDQIDKSIKLLNEVNITGAELAIKNIENGFESVRKQQLAIHMLKGNQQEIIENSNPE